MDFVEVACVAALLLKLRQKKRKRRYWVDPVISGRVLKGHFCQKYEELRSRPETFLDYTRMSIESFDKLLKLMSPFITYQNVVRECVSSKERLLVTLRYLATGNSFQSLHAEFLLGSTTIREIVRDTCDKLWRCLQPMYIKEKTTDDWVKIADGFFERTGFPNCIGAIDAKHIRLKRPSNTGTLYSNSKKYCSIVLLAVVDSNGCFSMVDIGAYGNPSDSQIFQNTNFARKLEQNRLFIPKKKVLPGDIDGIPMPFVFLSEEAYHFSENILWPYAIRKNLTNSKRIFNYRLNRAYKMVEGGFGLLSSKWKIFHRPLDTHLEFCDSIVKACCVLHNFVIRHDGEQLDENEDVSNYFINITPTNSRGTHTDEKYHTYFAKYFSSEEGSIPEQY